MTHPSPEELRRLYEVEGLSIDQIAVRYGVSHSPVVRWLKEAEIATRPSRRKAAPRPSAEELAELYVNQEQSMKALARRFAVSPSTVRSWSRADGIKFHTSRGGLADLPYEEWKRRFNK